MDFIGFTSSGWKPVLFHFCFIALYKAYFMFEMKLDKSEDSKNKDDKVIDSKWKLIRNISIIICLFLFFYYLYFKGYFDFMESGPVSDLSAIVGHILSWLQQITGIITHLYLGKSWSPVVTHQENQKLVTNGPYWFARHPMYTSLFLLPIGSYFLMSNRAIALSFLTFHLYICMSRVRREDKLLVELFGEEYARFHKERGAFFRWKPFGFDFGLSEKEVEEELKKNQTKSK